MQCLRRSIKESSKCILYRSGDIRKSLNLYELSEFLFFVHYSSGSSVQCVVSHKFDTQSSYQVAPDESNSFEISIPIDHNATALYIKLETQGLAANDSDGCFWSGKLSNFEQDGQCEDDGDER